MSRVPAPPPRFSPGSVDEQLQQVEVEELLELMAAPLPEPPEPEPPVAAAAARQAPAPQLSRMTRELGVRVEQGSSRAISGVLQNRATRGLATRAGNLRDVAAHVVDEPMHLSALVVRLIVPQLLVLGWLALVRWVCYRQEPLAFFPESTVVLTVGPGCIPAPLAVHPNGSTIVGAGDALLGPVVTPTNFAELLAPQNVKDSKESRPPIFIWEAHAVTLNSSAMAVPTSAGGFCAKGDADPKCAVRYAGGELFLALSPALLHANSLGLMRAEEHELTLELVPGWENCMPAAASENVEWVDQLVAWLMQHAGRREGFLARPPPPAELLAEPVGEYWSALDLSHCGDSMTMKAGKLCEMVDYVPSFQIKLFNLLLILTVVVVMLEVYAMWLKRLDQFSADGGIAGGVSAMLLPVASLGSAQAKRNRAALVARHVRTQIRDGFLVQRLAERAETLRRDLDVISSGGPSGSLQAEVAKLDEAVRTMEQTLVLQETVDATDAAEQDLTKSIAELHKHRQEKERVRREFWKTPPLDSKGFSENQLAFGRLVPFLVGEYVLRQPEIVRRNREQKSSVVLNEESVAADMRKSKKRAKHVHYPVDLEARQNVTLTVAEFTAFIRPALQDVVRQRELQGGGGLGQAGCGRLMALMCKGEGAYEHKICADIFEMIDVDGSNRVSFDELESYLMFFRADGGETGIGDDDEEDDETDEEEEDDDLDEESSDMYEQILECMAESDIDQIADNPGGINMAADMLFGGPVKVAESWATIVAAGTVQALLILTPMLVPLVSQWLRGSYPMKYKELYYSESLPVLGRQSDLEHVLFFAGVVFILVGMTNNVLYVVAQYQGLRPVAVGAEAKRKQTARKKQVWALKAAVSWLFKLLLVLWVLFSLLWLTQFGLLLIVAITVDPFRPFTVICVLGTVIGYAKIAVSSATSLRRRLQTEIQARYLEKNAGKLRVPKLRKKTMERMNKLIQTELDTLGLSFRGIAGSVALGTLGVAMVLAVVLLAQGLFYASKGTDPSSLISTLTPCAALLANKLSSSSSEKAQMDEKMDSVEATVSDTIQHAEKGEDVIRKSEKQLRKRVGAHGSGGSSLVSD